MTANTQLKADMPFEFTAPLVGAAVVAAGLGPDDVADAADAEVEVGVAVVEVVKLVEVALLTAPETDEDALLAAVAAEEVLELYPELIEEATEEA